MMSDASYLLECLSDRRWHSLNEILGRSITERGHGLTVHSRAADLRSRGYSIECRVQHNSNSRPVSEYRLVVVDTLDAANVPADPPSRPAIAPALAASSVSSNPPLGLRVQDSPNRDGDTLLTQLDLWGAA